MRCGTVSGTSSFEFGKGSGVFLEQVNQLSGGQLFGFANLKERLGIWKYWVARIQSKEQGARNKDEGYEL